MRFTVEDQLYNHGFLVERVMLSPEGILITMVVVGESESSDDFHVAPAQRTSFMKSAFERERALMNTSFFLSIDAIAKDAGGEGEEVGGGDTGAELIAAAAYDFLPATVDLCC